MDGVDPTPSREGRRGPWVISLVLGLAAAGCVMLLTSPQDELHTALLSADAAGLSTGHCCACPTERAELSKPERQWLGRALTRYNAKLLGDVRSKGPRVAAKVRSHQGELYTVTLERSTLIARDQDRASSEGARSTQRRLLGGDCKACGEDEKLQHILNHPGRKPAPVPSSSPELPKLEAAHTAEQGGPSEKSGESGEARHANTKGVYMPSPYGAVDDNAKGSPAALPVPVPAKKEGGVPKEAMRFIEIHHGTGCCSCTAP